ERIVLRGPLAPEHGRDGTRAWRRPQYRIGLDSLRGPHYCAWTMAPELRRRTLYDRLLAAIDELIEAHDDAVVHASPRTPRDQDVIVTAGPFASLREVQSFQGSLEQITGVRDVRIRGYEGADRAILEVTLGSEAEDSRAGATQ